MSIITEHQTPSYSYRAPSAFVSPLVQRPHVLLSAKKYNEVRKQGDAEMSEHFLREHLVAYRNYLAGQNKDSLANNAYAELILAMLHGGPYEELPPLPG